MREVGQSCSDYRFVHAYGLKLELLEPGVSSYYPTMRA
jgi:hypothetical protein